MSFAFTMILLAALAPYVTVGIAKAGAADFDNARPREWGARQASWRARALAAHQNHFEAFAPFAAAVFVAVLGGAAPRWTDLLAGAFIVLRLLYTVAYIKDTATLRSLIWVLGLLCVLALFAIGL